MDFSYLINKYEDAVISELPINNHKRKVFSQLKNCRTSALGGHLYVCPKCNETVLLFNSCRNRNCPVCQGNKRNKWVEKQSADLLNIAYSHVIFTVPDVLNSLFLSHPIEMNTILFRCSWETLKAFFADERFMGGKGGITAILHSWGQTLSLHPHVHCIVPGAGLDDDGNFVMVKGKNEFMFPVKALSKVFRAKFAAALTELVNAGEINLSGITRRLMFHKKWVVFCSPSSRKPQTIVNYLGRYTYRTAIAQSRIVGDENGEISFTYKNYKTQQGNLVMELSAKEFFHRYAMHIFPFRFVRIRHYGVMSNSCKKKFIEKGSEAVGFCDAQINTEQEFNDELPDNKNLQENETNMIKIFNTHEYDYKEASVNSRMHNCYIRESLVEVKNIEIMKL